MYTGIIITHGSMAQCLVNTIKKITDAKFDLFPCSNEGKDTDGIVDELLKAFPGHTDSTLFVFSEFVGGSTWFAANKFANERKNAYVLTGVNMPMLISFVTKQGEITAEKLADALQTDANRGISLKHYPGED